MFVLCSPHNPVGRVWDRATLFRLADLRAPRHARRERRNPQRPGHERLPAIPIASISAESAANTVTLVAATKTFNLAGLGGSICDHCRQDLRARFEAVQHSLFGVANAAGVAAAEAAWRAGKRG